MKNKILLNIGEVSKILNVSIQTIRRWDKKGKLISERSNSNQRQFNISSIKTLLIKNLFWCAKFWLLEEPSTPNNQYYCSNRAIFEARNNAMEKLLKSEVGDIYSIIGSSCGEIGNNSFDHNLGKWKDIPGIYFNYSFNERKIVLADRGQGLLQTLQFILPNLCTHLDALHIAFTEIITGRAPEKRGNGLKYVRRNVENGFFSLTYQSGDAELYLKSGEKYDRLIIKKSKIPMNGCIALIEY